MPRDFGRIRGSCREFLCRCRLGRGGVVVVVVVVCWIAVRFDDCVELVEQLDACGDVSAFDDDAVGLVV